MHCRSLIATSAAAVLAGSTTLAVAGSSSAVSPTAADSVQAAPFGSFAYSGEQAADFRLPEDVRKVHTATFPDGRTSTRYQQVIEEATVFGGQITLIEGTDGQADSVVGAYFPGLEPKNSAELSKREAKSVAVSKIGRNGDFSNELRIDPGTAHLFYEVESIRRSERPVRWVDAANGMVTKAFDKLARGEGTGVKGDTKQIDTTQSSSSGLFELRSGDDRQLTYDLQNRKLSPVVMTDQDDIWDYNKGITSPSQAAGVDAHYYANVVDDFYQSTFGRDSIDGQGMQIKSFVHYGKRYCNAFWNGSYMTYGDGDGKTCLPLSGGLDIDGHELTHGVTDYTSNLIYENESGALNEAFSDMMGNTIEFYAEQNNLDPAAEPDWLIGEDVVNTPGDTTPGFRNMGDPAQDGDPDHVVNKYAGTDDNGGVHTNSGIANHAYYLTVNGGRNAGCTATAERAATHTADCNVLVPALGLAEATEIYYTGFTSLPEYANFCDARNATSAVAQTNAAAIGAAWDAVGVRNGCAPGTPPPPPCVSDSDAKVAFESPHPYGNNGDCTWTYSNGSPGFQFHFSLLDTEAGYDYVRVKDADGNVLASYDGSYRRGATSPCIPTPSGSVQLVTDAAVTAPGFTVDAVRPC